MLGALGCQSAGAAVAPSPGTVLQQSLPKAPPLKAPRQVLQLPVPRLQKSASTLEIPVSAIRIQGNHLLADKVLMPLLAPVIGHTVRLGQLQAAVHRVTRAYQRRGYVLAYAFLPAQSVRNGRIRVRVVETRYDRIVLAGRSRANHGQVRRSLGVFAPELIEKHALDRGLLLLDRTPGLRVGATFIPGTRSETSTLRLDLHDQPMFSASLSEDNYGSVSTGRYRTQFRGLVKSPFGFGSQFAINGLTSSETLLHGANLLNSGGFALTSPDLSQGLRLGLYGSRTVYRLGGPFAAVGERGRAEQAGVDATYPVLLQPGRLLMTRLDLLRDSFALHSPAQGYETRSHLFLQRLTVEGIRVDAGGSVSTAVAVVTHGTLTGDNFTARNDLSTARGGSGGAFWILHLRLSQSAALGHGFSGLLSVAGQVASRNLDGSQQIYLGGPYGVMSYEQGSGGGAEGALARARVSHPLSLPPLAGRLDADLLLQGGTVWVNHSVYPGFTGSNRQNQGGVGLGLRYRWRSRVKARLAYVHVLGHDTSVPSGQLWAELKVNF